MCHGATLARYRTHCKRPRRWPLMKTKEILLAWSRRLEQDTRNALREFPSIVGVQAPQPLKIRIVSMPCWELFDEQDLEYQDAVLLSNYNDILRIYVEKAATKKHRARQVCSFLSTHAFLRTLWQSRRCRKNFGIHA